MSNLVVADENSYIDAIYNGSTGTLDDKLTELQTTLTNYNNSTVAVKPPTPTNGGTCNATTYTDANLYACQQDGYGLLQYDIYPKILSLYNKDIEITTASIILDKQIEILKNTLVATSSTLKNNFIELYNTQYLFNAELFGGILFLCYGMYKLMFLQTIDFKIK